MTEVHNINNFNEIQIFSLPPNRAVVAADRQSKGDLSTWDYDRYQATEGKYGFISGDFWAKKAKKAKKG